MECRVLWHTVPKRSLITQHEEETVPSNREHQTVRYQSAEEESAANTSAKITEDYDRQRMKEQVRKELEDE